jgi:hypothetical protein
MNCPVCSSKMEAVFRLPDYPFTDKWGTADQAFLFCECGHGMLETVYPQESWAMGESHYLSVFADFVKKHAGPYDKILDIGGGDASLCKMFKGAYEVIDPSVNCGIEDAYLQSFKFTHKLILSSHTLEHITDPNVFMQKVSGCLRDGDTVALQLPSLECLVDDQRFDQVFHQHVHYFSERSLTSLMAKYGLKVIACEFNRDHWGAIMVVAQKGEGHTSGREINRMDVAFSRFAFTTGMGLWKYRLRKGGFVIFGDSPMLEVMDYHLQVLNKADFIADDDPLKEGLWRNKLVTADYSLEGRDVVITSSSQATAKKLMAKALRLGAASVYTPFQ